MHQDNKRHRPPLMSIKNLTRDRLKRMPSHLRNTTNLATGEPTEILGTPDTSSQGGINPYSPTDLEALGYTDADLQDRSRSGTTAFDRNQGPDPSSFDVTDPEQVRAFQKFAGLEEDAQFGPKTEGAWRSYVDRTRKTAGQESYAYDDSPLSPNNLQGNKSMYDLIEWSDETQPGTGREGYFRPDEANVDAYIDEKTAAGDYSGEADTSVWGALKGGGSNVLNYFSDMWNK